MARKRVKVYSSERTAKAALTRLARRGAFGLGEPLVTMSTSWLLGFGYAITVTSPSGVTGYWAG